MADGKGGKSSAIKQNRFGGGGWKMVHQYSRVNREGLVACHECDTLQYLEPLPEGRAARCVRCRALLARNPRGGLERPLVLQATALLLWLQANLFPFMTLEIQGRQQTTSLSGASLALYESGMGWLAAVVLLTTVAGPLLLILSSLYVLLGVRGRRLYPGMRGVLVTISHLQPWAMLDVFMLGVLVSFVKLAGMADVLLGPALYAFVGLMLVSAAAWSGFEPRLLWNRMELCRD